MGQLLNQARERERQAKMKSGGNSKTWKPEEGSKNIIRVLTFKHKVTKEDIALGLYEKKELGETVNEWTYPFQMHYGLNPKNRKAPVRSTPEIMALWQKLKGSKMAEDKEKAERIKPSKKYALNIVDINNPDKGVQIYLAPKTVREAVGDHVISPHYGEEVLGVKGRDWQISFDPNADPKGMYKVIILPEKASRAMNSKVEKLAHDLYSPEVNGAFADIVPMSQLDVANVGDAPPVEDLEGPAVAEKETNGAKGGIFDVED